MQITEIAHLDSPDATWKNVEIPDIVRIFMDFNPERQIGKARLTWLPATTIDVDGKDVEVPGALKAICEIEDDEEIGEQPMLQPALVDAKRYLDADRQVAYIQGGRVANLSVVSPVMQREIFGTEVAAERQANIEETFDV